MCLFNLTFIGIFFEKFKHHQNRCYYESNNYQPHNWDKGIDCFQSWVGQDWNYNFWRYIADLNGIMIVGFSEPLAIIPYLLRALRVKKLFDAREIYCDTDKMPRKFICMWRENNLIKKFLLVLFVVSSLLMVFEMINIYYG